MNDCGLVNLCKVCIYDCIKQCCCEDVNDAGIHEPLLSAEKRNEVLQQQPQASKNNTKSMMTEKRKRIEQLKEEKDQLLLKLSGYYSKVDEEIKLALQKKREELLQDINIEDLKQTHEVITKCLLVLMERHVTALLTITGNEGKNVTEQQKEQYKVYGLLLSAVTNDDETDLIIMKKEVKAEVCDRLSLDLNESEDIERNVVSSVDLTHVMLTLLPPLLVIQPQWQDDNVQDTNRQTWDDETSDQPLIYYRPVLVYGNQLHVAVKGIVGNVTTIEQT